MNSGESAAAWSWILEHSNLIERICFKVAAGVDAEDLRHDVMLSLVDRHSSYDASRSGASTWVWWRARDVRQRMIRQRKVSSWSDISPDEIEASLGSTESIEKAIRVAEVMAVASPTQRAAAETLMLGLSGAETQSAIGCGLQARNARLYRLGDRIGRNAQRG